MKVTTCLKQKNKNMGNVHAAYDLLPPVYTLKKESNMVMKRVAYLQTFVRI